MDDELFSSILYLLPIAAVIFFRVFAANRKAKRAKEGQSKSEAVRRELERRIQAKIEADGRPVPLSSISGREPESQEWKPHWIEQDEDISEVVDEEGPEPSQRLVLSDARMPSGVGFPSPSAPPLAGPAGNAPSPSAAALPTERALSFSDFPLSGSGPSLFSPADLSNASDDAEKAAGGPFHRDIDRLPPLKKALVLAEVLGKPKALTEGESRR